MMLVDSATIPQLWWCYHRDSTSFRDIKGYLAGFARQLVDNADQRIFYVLRSHYSLGMAIHDYLRQCEISTRHNSYTTPDLVLLRELAVEANKVVYLPVTLGKYDIHIVRAVREVESSKLCSLQSQYVNKFATADEW